MFIGRGSTKTKRIKEVQKRLRDALAMEHPEEMKSVGEAAQGTGGDGSNVAPSTVEKTGPTPNDVVDEHMTISAAAAAADKRRMSSERRRPT